MNFNVSSWRKDTTSEKMSQVQSPSNKAPASFIVRLKFYVKTNHSFPLSPLIKMNH